MYTVSEVVELGTHETIMGAIKMEDLEDSNPSVPGADEFDE